MKVAIQGELGSNHHVITKKLMTVSDYELYCAKSFPELFAAVEKGDADFAVLAIENSLMGSILQNYDLLSKYNYTIIAEGYLRIEHCLIGFPGAKVEDIKVAYSQDPALKQCVEFLEKHNIEPREYYDTAASVPYIKGLGDKSFAGIASSIAAEIYGMEIIQRGIETNKENYTRFIVAALPEKAEAAKKVLKLSPQSEKKTMIEFEVKHQPGALAIVLTLLAAFGFNLTKIESRPIIGDKWNYRFYVDFVSDESVEEINTHFGEIKDETKNLKIHGTFPVGEYFGANK